MKDKKLAHTPWPEWYQSQQRLADAPARPVVELKADPDKWARYVEWRKEYMRKYYRSLPKSVKQERNQRYWQNLKNKMAQDPDRLARYKENVAQAAKRSYEKRKALYQAQGLNTLGRVPRPPRPKPEPKITPWEMKTGRTLQEWADQIGVSRERVRQLLSKAQQRLDDYDQMLAEMKRTGEWPDFKGKLQLVRERKGRPFAEEA